ncbi:MAG: hypothetical protein IIC21_02740 [Chloroflexi bacterium]|nr:hypothetical protein [Chloroflexota bacterium]
MSRTQDGKTIVTVQVSHCSMSVGASEVAEALAAALPDDAVMITAGCDGACFDAPQVLATTASGERHRYVRVNPESAREIAAQVASGSLSDTVRTNGFHSGQRRITLDGCGELDCEVIDSYLDRGGYSGLANALAMSAEELIEEVKESGLRGRGGAYFPAALKWQGARSVNVEPRYLVVNSEEGEPGVFKDRHLMEGVPHRILEGAIIAAYATGANFALIYINAEADLSAEVMQHAVDQASQFGIIGKDILGSGFELSVEIRRGAGGYVCGEETTLLNTVEGYRREPRLRSPFPTEPALSLPKGWGRAGDGDSTASHQPIFPSASIDGFMRPIRPQPKSPPPGRGPCGWGWCGRAAVDPRPPDKPGRRRCCTGPGGRSRGTPPRWAAPARAPRRARPRPDPSGPGNGRGRGAPARCRGGHGRCAPAPPVWTVSPPSSRCGRRSRRSGRSRGRR